MFSAFGCTAVDVRHRYEVLIPPGGYSRESVRQALDHLLRRAGWDLAAEGFLGREGTCQVSLLGHDGRERYRSREVPLGPKSAEALANSVRRTATSATTLALVVTVPISELSSTPTTALAPAAAPENGTERTVWWDGEPTVTRVVGIRDISRGG